MNLKTSEKRSRIAVLLDHSGHGDGRVKRAALALRERGFSIRVFALVREANFDQFGGLEALDGTDIPLTPICVQEHEFAPIPRWLISVFRPLRRALRKRAISNPPDHDAPTSKTQGDDSEVSRPSLVAKINRTLGALFWHRALTRAFRAEVNRFRPQLIHAHDLSTLGVGALLARGNGAKLIYDSHEFELGRNGVELNTAELVRQSHERIYIRHADSVVSVSETIADRLTKIYRIPPPAVIPNITKLTPSHKQSMSRADLGLSEHEPLILYVGSLAQGRGLEMAIDALSLMSEGVLALAGNASEIRRRNLMTYAERSSSKTRLKILETVPEAQVVDLLSLADLSIVPIQATCESYRLCLPNKVFQSLAAGTPIVSTPLPEIGAIISKFANCRISADFSSQAFASALTDALNDRNETNVSIPEGFEPNVLLSRYAKIAEALIGDQPALTFPPLANASEAIAVAAQDKSWTPARAPFSLAMARTMAIVTSFGSSRRQSD